MYATFVFFDFISYLEKRFEDINDLGRDWIKSSIRESDLRYVMTYGWKTILFSHYFSIRRLKRLSVYNSLLSLLLLFIAAYVPEYRIGGIVITLILFLFVLPIA